MLSLPGRGPPAKKQKKEYLLGHPSTLLGGQEDADVNPVWAATLL